MKSMRTLVFAFGLSVPAAGCATFAETPPPGLIYTGAKGVARSTRAEMTSEKPGPNTGTACTKGVLGLASWGDMSLKAAKANGHITKVHTLDFSSFNVLGFYMRNCTIITGE